MITNIQLISALSTVSPGALTPCHQETPSKMVFKNSQATYYSKRTVMKISEFAFLLSNFDVWWIFGRPRGAER